MPAKARAQKAGTPFGLLLRSWRTSRHLTQMDLALEAGVSARHLGFLECGRSSPSREMLLTLADALEIPLREQNVLLQATGFASVFRESDLTAPDVAGIRTALELILRRRPTVLQLLFAPVGHLDHARSVDPLREATPSCRSAFHRRRSGFGTDTHSLNRLPAGENGCPMPEAMSSSTRRCESFTTSPESL